MKMTLMICAALLLMPIAACTENSELTLYIAGHEDPLIDAQDLAFVLTTHNFDARPSGNLVAVKTEGATYILKPNGQKHGLADIVGIAN